MRKPCKSGDDDIAMEPEDILLEDERIQRPIPKKLRQAKGEETATPTVLPIIMDLYNVLLHHNTHAGLSGLLVFWAGWQLPDLSWLTRYGACVCMCGHQKLPTPRRRIAHTIGAPGHLYLLRQQHAIAMRLPSTDRLGRGQCDQSDYTYTEREFTVSARYMFPIFGYNLVSSAAVAALRSPPPPHHHHLHRCVRRCYSTDDDDEPRQNADEGVRDLTVVPLTSIGYSAYGVAWPES
ncbi:unnamed protein product [Heligmosomoides polygyrus]|uniref:Uncharacterized protein n=1 Tax=Heligmosomoides polygyrus TaxID=6339 RepID=A0A3P8AQA9_HELPZ|nr:unnamed protein product [Heligmosomoides polygyrus]